MMNEIEKNSQEMMNKKDIVYIVAYIFVFLLLINIFGLLSTVENFCFTSNQVSNLLGIIISCISIVITAYFVVLAIDAYGKIKEIDKAKAKADELIQTASSAEKIVSKAEGDTKNLSDLIKTAGDDYKRLKDYSNEIDIINKNIKELANDINSQFKKNKQILVDASHEIGEILISFNESAVVHAEQEKNRDLKDSSLRRLFRLSYRYPELLNESTRKRYILNLASYGDESDIQQLEKICNSDTETEVIKRTTAYVLEDLKKKFKS